MTKSISIARLLLAPMMALFLVAVAHASTPGIIGPTFNLTAQTAFLNQPDGSAVYSWGYGCNGAPTGFRPTTITTATCPTMQVPGPTLIVTEGQTVTVHLSNGLPAAAGNTSILFPGFVVTTTGGVAGLLTQEALPCPTSSACTTNTVTYTFVATSPGTHPYYSGSQGDLQIEMGMYGAVIVIPASDPTGCDPAQVKLSTTNPLVETSHGEVDFRLAHYAYDHCKSAYDREYLFQWAEMDPNIHKQALAQITATTGCTAGTPGCSLNVPTEPYSPAYFLINGRSMPDVMDGNYAVEYPHQPYNGNPHMHPGEQVLVRAIGQGRWQHPFHEHGNHVRILGRDGNLILSKSDSTDLAGLLMFNTDTTPGQAFEGIFYWTGRGLNWDPYGHHVLPVGGDTFGDLAANVEPPCSPDVNGYYTVNSPSPAPVGAINYYEWCQDHNKPLEVAPLGSDVGSGGPATLPDPNIFTNGAWYGGTPYLGPDASLRAFAPNCSSTTNANCTPLQPFNTQANPANERGYAFMWHSHNEREITTNNVFPGGMLMMMLVDSREFVIDESN
jgi:FtsP/CotA-like multicopper oxidase with cupredoxin domain